MFDAISNTKNSVFFSLLRLSQVALFLGASILLLACGGSDDTPVDQNPNGLFTGTGTIDGTTVSDLKAISYNNRLMMFSMDHNLLYDATINSVTENSYTASVDVYEDGVKLAQTVTLSGGVTSGSSLSGTLNGTGKASGSIALTFQNIYSRSATDARINSTSGTNVSWTGPVKVLIPGQMTNDFDKTDAATNNFTFNSDTLTPSITQCSYEGTITIPNPNANIYDVSQDRVPTNDVACTLSTTPIFTGWATVVDGTNVDDTMWYAVANGTHSVVAVLTH